jgi:GDP-L-fucose synthase
MPAFEIDKSAPVFVSGHLGLAGSAIWRALHTAGYSNVFGRSSAELDLREREVVFDFFRSTRPRYAILAAARVGGVYANSTYPNEFLSDNVRIQVNVLDAAASVGVERLVFLSSAAVYPKDAPQPMTETSLLSGELEPTQYAYAMAKLTGMMQVRAIRQEYGLPWISVIPTNLYGSNDRFTADTSHVIPALIMRYCDAVDNEGPAVSNWGTGSPRRDFLHADDLGNACAFLLENYDDPTPINIGTGSDHAMREVAEIVADATGYTGETFWDSTKPDGRGRMLLDVSRLTELGWQAQAPLRAGIASTVEWYRQNKATIRL